MRSCANRNDLVVMREQELFAIHALRDKLYYPGTNTYKNYFHEKDPVLLNKLEATSAQVNSIKLIDIDKNIGYGIERMQQIHKTLFEKVYPWAGELREQGLRKPREDEPIITRFSHSSEFPAMSQKIEEQAKQVLALRDADFSRSPQEVQGNFVDRISDLYQTCNQMHPFYEGNGRTQRVYLSDVAKVAGWQVQFDKVDARAWNYAAALSTKGEMSGVTVEAKTDKLKQVFGHVCEHTKAAHNPYLRGKLGDMAPKQHKLGIEQLNPTLSDKKTIKM